MKQQNLHKLAAMKTHVMGTVATALLLIGSLLVVQADDKKEAKDPLTEKYATKEKEIGAALKSGLISKEIAERILKEYERQLKADQRRGQFRNRQAGGAIGDARARADKAREDARARMEERRKKDEARREERRKNQGQAEGAGARAGGGGVFQNSTSISVDGKGGRYTLTVRNGEKRFKAEGGGALLFDGPVDTQKQRETLDTKKVYEGLVNAKQKPAQTKATAAATALTKAQADKTLADKALTAAKAAAAAKALTKALSDKTLADKALSAVNTEVAKAKTTFESASFSAPNGNLLKKLEQMEEGRVGNRAAAFRGRWEDRVPDAMRRNQGRADRAQDDLRARIEEMRGNRGKAFDPFARQRLGGFNRRDSFRDLDLNEEQQKAIAAIQQKQREEQLEYEEMMEELDETFQKRMEGILTDKHKEKYKELQTQRNRRFQPRRPADR